MLSFSSFPASLPKRVLEHSVHCHKQGPVQNIMIKGFFLLKIRIMSSVY
jgi:hypothetical protein